jgi:hypothetical protein
MISAPFWAGCPSAIDRVRWLVLSRGGLDLLPWPLPLPGTLILCMPAVVVTALVLWTWSSRRARLAPVLFVIGAAVHPPLTMALTPLFAWMDAPPLPRRTMLLRLAAILAATTAILWWATPSCGVAERSTMLALAAGALPILSAAVGPIVGALALLETLRSPGALLTRLTWLVLLASIVAVWVFQNFAGAATLMPGCVLLWWLAMHGAASLVRRQPTMVARLGALTLMLLIPVLQVVPVARAGPPPPSSAATSAREITEALDDMWRPAAIVAEDAAHSLLTMIWSAGDWHHTTTVQILDPWSHQAETALQTRAVYAFAGGAQRLARFGLWMGPVEPAPPTPTPVLWRAYASQGCMRLTPEWQDVSGLAVDGQLSALFSFGSGRREAVIYAAMSDEAIGALPSPPDGSLHYTSIIFDASKPEDRAIAAETMRADGFLSSMVPPGAAFLARVALQHIERTPGAMVLAFASPPQQIFAHRDTDPAPGPLELCRSSQDLTVVGHREAPRRATISLSSPAVAGRGWHASEREGDSHFRWTAAPVAEIRFIAIQPAPFTLAFQVLDTAVPTAGDELAVSLNGVAGTCKWDAAERACELPIDAIRPGLNVAMLHAPVRPASPSEPRARGVKVGRIELRHRGDTGRDFPGPRH